jgi:hypothetical protein
MQLCGKQRLPRVCSILGHGGSTSVLPPFTRLLCTFATPSSTVCRSWTSNEGNGYASLNSGAASCIQVSSPITACVPLRRCGVQACAKLARGTSSWWQRSSSNTFAGSCALICAAAPAASQLPSAETTGCPQSVLMQRSSAQRPRMLAARPDHVLQAGGSSWDRWRHPCTHARHACMHIHAQPPHHHQATHTNRWHQADDMRDGGGPFIHSFVQASVSLLKQQTSAP